MLVGHGNQRQVVVAIKCTIETLTPDTMNRYQHSGLLFMETQENQTNITEDMFVYRAKELLRKGNEGNNKVYKEVRMYLQKYADGQNKLCRITVPYYTHKMSPHTLASLLMLWCSIIDESNARP